MCIGFPGQVIAVDAFGATVETEGRPRRASTLMYPEVEVGEWVFVAAGSIVERLDPEQAELVRATLLEALALEDAEAQATAARGVA